MIEPTRKTGFGSLSPGQVIALIVVMLILLISVWGALPAVRERRRRADCDHILRTFGLLTAMYADVNNERCPVDAADPTLVGCMQLYSNFVGTAKILHCPSDPRSNVFPEMRYAKLTTNNISYSYVPNLIWQDRVMDSVIMLDRIYTTSAGSSWPTNGNHRGRIGALLYNDGRVEWKTRLPQVLKDKDGHEIVLSP